MGRLLFILGVIILCLGSCKSAKDLVSFTPTPGAPHFTLSTDTGGKTVVCEDYGAVLEVDTARIIEMLKEGIVYKDNNFEIGFWIDDQGKLKFYERGCVYLKQ
jgi:hypothetical protein